MASNPFIGGVNPPDFITGSISQAGALGGQLNSRRTEPLISARGGEVARVTFGNSSIYDPLNVWTEVGNPGVGGMLTGGGVRESSTGFTAADYWRLGAGLDNLDFAADFSACVVYTFSTRVSEPIIFSNGASGSGNSAGYFLEVGRATASPVLAFMAGGVQSAITAPLDDVLGVVNVVCFGRAGSTGYLKTNLTALRTGVAGTIAAGTAYPAQFGRGDLATLVFSAGQLYEAWFSTQTPSDALFTAIATEVKTKLGITAW